MKSQLDRLLVAALLLCLGAFSWVLYDTLQEKHVQAGDTAPRFSVTADNGRTYSRSDFGGKVLVLNFWATWCPPCLQEMPSLEAMHRQFKDQGVVVLAVSVDKNEKAYKDFLSRNSVTFTTARDPKASISTDYGTFKYPETYIIDSTGTVREKMIGAENWMSPAVLGRIKNLL